MSTHFTVARPGTPEKRQETKDAQKVLRRLAHRLKGQGFDRTKSTFFTRPRTHVIEFVHVHKYTFGPLFRVHLGIRVKLDEHPAANLNGPSSEHDTRYDVSFESDVQSIDACADALAAFVNAVGGEWFQTFQAPERLMTAANSPLQESSKEILKRALEDPSNASTSVATRLVLGVD